ncbi:MAG TPA: CsbD family protein [Patescibacteria group bacterium]|nr:CsbD family protein [Patescibacteria group bacterium]
MSDMMDKMSGKAKELTGKVTHNHRLEMRGKLQHDMADLRHKTKDAANHMTDQLLD